MNFTAFTLTDQNYLIRKRISWRFNFTQPIEFDSGLQMRIKIPKLVFRKKYFIPLYYLMKSYFTLFFILFSSLSFAQYRGKVFIDDNANKALEVEEKGLQGVSVSDGLHVIKTNADGEFDLPGYDRTRFIFITVPAGYRLSDKHYLKVDDKREAYHFGLIPDVSTSGNTVKLLQITDTETFVYGDWIANIRNYAKEENAGLIVHTGDICYEKGMNFHSVQVTTDLLQKQIFYGVGNHDLVKGEYGEKLFEDLYGPTYYSFDAGPVHFIMTPMPSGDYKPSYTVDEVIRWMRNDLAKVDKNKPVVVFNHDLPIYNGEFIMKGEKESINLDQHNLKAWIYGHWHNSFVKKFDGSGVYAISTSGPNQGGIDNSAARFLAIDFDENGLADIESKYTYLKKHLVITSPRASNMSLVKEGFLYLSASVYDSELAIKEVKASVYDDKGHLSGQQILSASADWNWNGTMPVKNNWYGKNLTVQVEAVFGNGESVIQKQEFRLTKDFPKVLTAGNWPSLLGNASHNQTASSSSNSSLQLAWMANVNANIWKGAPIFADQRVFVATIDDATNDYVGIDAIDAKTGQLLWHYETQNSVKNAISYAEGMVLATDAEGIAYAIQASNGQLVWKKELGMTYLPAYVTGGVVEDGVYYTGFAKYLQALEVSTGNVLWKNEAWSGGESTPSSMTIAGDVLISGANWNSLFGQDKKTGKLLWKRNDEGLRFRSSTATYMDEKLFVTGLNSLLVLDPVTGKTLNSTETEYAFKVMAAPLVTDDLIIMPTAEDGLIAFDKNTLVVKWHRPTGEALVYSAPYTGPDSNTPTQTIEASVVKWGNTLLFGASDGFFYVLNETTGEIVEKINLGSPVFSEVSISGNTCFVADFSGNVYGFTRD